jgi:hypothetical protein
LFLGHARDSESVWTQEKPSVEVRTAGRERRTR